MKTLFLFIICIIVNNAIAFSQDTYYYADGKKIALKEINDMLAIELPNDGRSIFACDGITRIDQWESTQAIKTIYKILDGSYTVSEIKAIAKEKLGTDAFVFSCYETTPYMENEYVFPTRSISIKLRDIGDLQLLEDIAEEYGLKILGQDKYMPLWWTLFYEKNRGTYVVDIANAIYERGLFCECCVVLGGGSELDGIDKVDAEDNHKFSNVEAIYTVGGAKVATLQKGINIVRLANGKTVKVVK